MWDIAVPKWCCNKIKDKTVDWMEQKERKNNIKQNNSVALHQLHGKKDTKMYENPTMLTLNVNYITKLKKEKKKTKKL